MSFGHITITLVQHVKGSTPGELGTYPVIEQTVDLPGCRHRPLTFKESVELSFDVATQIWKSTIPTHEYDDDLYAKLVAAQPDDTIRVNGIEYDIVAGVECFDDFTKPFKATIYSKRHIG